MYISIIAKATPFEDARVKEQGELLEREGKCFLDKTYIPMYFSKVASMY